MSTIAEIIARARFKLTTENNQNYTNPAELLGYANEALSGLHSHLTVQRPELLMESYDGATTADNPLITIDALAVRTLEIWVDNNRIAPTRLSNVEYMGLKGRPVYYMRQGMTAARQTRYRLFKTPDAAYPVTVFYVPEFQRVSDPATVFPFPFNMEPVVEDYIVMRAFMSDEYDVSAETALLNSALERVNLLLAVMDPQPEAVSGYYKEDY